MTPQIQTIEIIRIFPNKHQPRHDFDSGDLVGLTQSIRESGVIQPILVKKSPDGNHFELIAGERRWRAAKAAGMVTIPAIVRTLTEQESLKLAITENVQRADLNAIEEAKAYRQLMDEFGYSQQMVATSVGKSRPHVGNAIRLLSLPASVLSLITSGHLTAGHARTLIGTPDAEKRAVEIVEQNQTVREAERIRYSPRAADLPSHENSGASEPRYSGFVNDVGGTRWHEIPRVMQELRVMLEALRSIRMHFASVPDEFMEISDLLKKAELQEIVAAARERVKVSTEQ